MKQSKTYLMAFLDGPYAWVLSLCLSLTFVYAPKASILILPFLFCLTRIWDPKAFFTDIAKASLLLPLTLFFIWSFASISWSLNPAYAAKSTLLAMLLVASALGLSTYLYHMSSPTMDKVIAIASHSFCLSIGVWAIALGSHSLLIEMTIWLKGSADPAFAAGVGFKSAAFAIGGISLLMGGWYFSQGKHIWGLVGIVLTLLLSMLSHSTTAFLGIALGSLVLMLSIPFPIGVGRILGLGVVLANFAFPLLIYTLPISEYAQRIYQTHGIKTFSFYHRTVIWEFTIGKWLEKPILGWGAASSRNIPGSDQEIAPSAEVLSLHPHNHFLQATLELGTVGAFLYTALLLCILWKIHTTFKSPLARGTAFGLFAMLYVFCSAEHSLWHHWWIAWLGIFASFCVLICSRIERLQAEQPLDRTRDR